MASDQDLHRLSFSLWIWTKTLYDVIWLADSQKWVWLIKLYSRIRVKVEPEKDSFQQQNLKWKYFKIRKTCYILPKNGKLTFEHDK